MSKKSTYKVWIHVERWEDDEPIEVEAAEPRSVDTEFTTLRRAIACVDDMLSFYERRVQKEN